jgi:hypothetical protein
MFPTGGRRTLDDVAAEADAASRHCVAGQGNLR